MRDFKSHPNIMALKRKYVAREAPLKPTCYELRERTAQGKVVKVNKRFRPSRKDPFHVLGDHEVRDIISYLEARDTETLRRVSTLWKASSEYHCERSVLLQHFPWMATEISESTTREEMNLLFRRCLYHQESMKAGLATRAIKFSGAREWHIRGAHIVWSNLQESVSIRVLSSSKASSSSKSETTRLKVEKLVPKGYNVKFVQIISEDEILVTAQAERGHHWYQEFGPQKLILISLSGETKWIADVRDPSTRPAIGRASLCLINYRMVGGLTSPSDNEMLFTKLSLSTGSLEMNKVLPVTDKHYGIHSERPSRNVSLTLSKDEKYAMWVDRYISPPYASSVSHHIACTTTGSLLYSYKKDHHLGFMAAPSITQNAVWAYGFPQTMSTQQNPHDKSWATRGIHLPKPSHECYSSTAQLGFEGDHSLFSHLIHSKRSEIEKQKRLSPSGPSNSHRPSVMRTSKFGVSTAVRGTDALMVDETIGPSDVAYTPSTPWVVTLPDEFRRRRELEVKLPWSNSKNDFFGFVEGFIVYHNKMAEVLVLIDFRPEW